MRLYALWVWGDPTTCTLDWYVVADAAREAARFVNSLKDRDGWPSAVVTPHEIDERAPPTQGQVAAWERQVVAGVQALRARRVVMGDE